MSPVPIGLEREQQTQPAGLFSFLVCHWCAYVSWVLQLPDSFQPRQHWYLFRRLSGCYHTPIKTVLQKIYHWMIHCSCILLSCQPVVTQLSTCLRCAFLCLFHTCEGSQSDSLPSVCRGCQHDIQRWQRLRKEAWDVNLTWELIVSLWANYKEATVVTAQVLGLGGVARRWRGRVRSYDSAFP